MTLTRFPDPGAAAEACGAHVLGLLQQAIDATGRATLAISGGASPKPMFRWFAHRTFPWNRVHLFWVDERCVPPTHPQSNFKMTNDAWLAPAKFPEPNIHRIRAELPPREAVMHYANEIFWFFGVKGEEMPRFDVIHRGMGPDGHTASLFPGEPFIDDRRSIAASLWAEPMHQFRITLLPGVLEAARNTALLVTGADKAQALDAALHAPYDPKKYPVQIASREGDNVTWFVDDPAAALLPR
jgi:6-phosphogluconolactonase